MNHLGLEVYFKGGDKLYSRFDLGAGNLRIRNVKRMQVDELLEDGGFQVRRIGGLERPSLEPGTMKAIQAVHPKNAAGQFIEPKSGKVIVDPVHGHLEGFENWRILEQANRLGLNQAQLKKFVNAHPHYFEMQGKKINESHLGELLGIDPRADRQILQDMEKFFGL